MAKTRLFSLLLQAASVSFVFLGMTRNAYIKVSEYAWECFSGHFHVFVGDLSPEVDNKALKDAFVPFGEVS